MASRDFVLDYPIVRRDNLGNILMERFDISHLMISLSIDFYDFCVNYGKKDQYIEKGFWKFTTACGNPAYKPKDSFCEKLRCSKKTFCKVKNPLCTYYPSKTSFDKELDPFKGKPMASYRNVIEGKTYYFLNHPLIDEIQAELNRRNNATLGRNKKSLQSIPLSSVQSFPIGANLYKQITTQTTTTLETVPPVEVLPPEQPPVVLVYQQRLEQTPQRVELVPQTPLPVLIRQKMVGIFETMTGKKVPYPEKYNNRCFEFLKQELNGNIEKWEEVCETAARNAYLMGETGTKKFILTFYFLLNKERMENILGGYYGMNTWILKDKVLNKKEKISNKRKELNESLSNIKRKMTYDTNKILEGRRQNIKVKAESLTPEREEMYRIQWNNENPRQPDDIEQMRGFHFQGFVNEKIQEELNYSPDIAADPELLQKEQQLLNEIAQLNALEQQLIREEKEENGRFKSLIESVYKPSNGKGNFASA